MMRTLLVRGMVAGLISGVLATLFAYLVGEPSVDLAIGFEEAVLRFDGAAGFGRHNVRQLAPARVLEGPGDARLAGGEV